MDFMFPISPSVSEVVQNTELVVRFAFTRCWQSYFVAMFCIKYFTLNLEI